MAIHRASEAFSKDRGDDNGRSSYKKRSTSVSSANFPKDYFTQDEMSKEEKPKERRSRRTPVAELPHEEQVEKAKELVLYSLTASSKTRKQLEEKLASKEYPENVIAEVLDRLTEVHLIDDSAYAKNWAISRQNFKGLSASAIRRELKTKGILEEDIEEALAHIDVDAEKEKAVELVENKLRSVRNLDRQTATRRLVGMLARKGYGGSMAYSVVKEALDSVQNADDDSFLDTP